MNDLISRQDALDALRRAEALTRAFGYHNVIETIRELPSAQPERKKGKWVWSEENASWCCGACDCVFEEIDWKPEYNFCPNCGADMRGEEE